MKTILIFQAPDIFMRDLVIQKLEQNGIATFGADSSINVIYPNTPNLYLSGASAVTGGYRVLVAETNAEKAHRLIMELQEDLAVENTNLSVDSMKFRSHDLSISENDPVKQLYFYTILGFFLPVLPSIFALYYLAKSVKTRKSISPPKLVISATMILWNICLSYIAIVNF